ncbi:MAG: hypothetical protein RML46_12340, partial [Anaerolineae bacterium]|nr:hypothetical protein [Anaerolineae bacterium]
MTRDRRYRRWVIGLLWALVAVWGWAQPAHPPTGRLKVEIFPAGAGSVTLDPSGDLYGGFYWYPDLPTTVRLTASPSSGYTFVRWEIWRSIPVPATGNPEERSANPTSITLSYTYPDWTVRAVFVRTYTITVSANPAAGGTVTGGGTYAHGATVTVTAQANPGYDFLNWTENGTVVSTDASYSFTATGNRTLVANFALKQYTITVSANPAAGGTVTGGG